MLLRLAATLTRQWIDTSREFILRLDADLPAIRRDLGPAKGNVAKIESDVSDPHNGGRSVRVVAFADGSRVLYKPKDLRLDIAWRGLAGRLNQAGAPVELKAVHAIARDGYGWTEFIEHAGTDAEGCKRFFRRAGAWLALFHCFAAADMHQENMIAAGDHPVPIDLETILHATPAHKTPDPEGAGLRCCHRNAGQFGDDGRPAARLRALPVQRCLCHRRTDIGLDGEDVDRLDRHQQRCDAADQGKGRRRA